ncbi:hypothetical protein [Rhizobium sp.]|uniref:hypothetical protein n=1 Tax=Rhizobium sp. TaxID=391 RepID=UPI00389A5C86
MLGLADLEPFVCVEWRGITIPTVWALRVAIEHAEHLLAACNALKNLGDCGRGDHLRLLARFRTEVRRRPLDLAILFNPS